MVSSAMPDRKEMSDITVACIDGADGFILSHETSLGPNFLAASVNLAKSIAEAENLFDHE